jgi:SPP1 gp7 family putative phage head morphogenesis protein
MPTPRDNAAIARQLRSDSDALRYAEWWTRRKIYGLEDEELRRLRDEYLIAYREIMATLPQAYDEGGNVMLAHRARVLGQIERELEALIAEVGPGLGQSVEDGWRQGYYGRAWLLDTVTVQDWNATKNVLIPSEAIRSLLVQDYIGVDTWIDMERGALVDGIRRSLTQSMIQGEGMAKARNRLVKELGIKPGQTKNFKGSMHRTMLIARTEIMRASNLGALSIYEQNQDVLSGWEWVATLDERTCRICGGLDGRVFKFGSSQLQPPSGSHVGCRCTIVPVLRDKELMDSALGGRPRQVYCDWAAQNGIVGDANLCRQRGSAPPKKPPPVKSASQLSLDRLMRENRVSKHLAKGVTPEVLNTGAAPGPIQDYMYNFFAYDDQANPTFSAELVDKARLDTLFSVYTLGKGNVQQQTINDVRTQSASILAANDFLDGTVLDKSDVLKLTALSDELDEVVLGEIDRIRDRRLKGTIEQSRQAALNRGQSYGNFTSAAAEDGAQRLREANMPWYAAR